MHTDGRPRRGESRTGGTVRFVSIDGSASFVADDMFPYDAEVDVHYLTAQELRAPITSTEAAGMDKTVIEKSFTDTGFANVKSEPVRDLKLGLLEKDAVIRVAVNGNEGYSRGDVMRPDDEVVIYYHDYVWAN